MEALESGNVPVNITVVLPPCGKVLVQLDTSEDAVLALYGANEANGALHIARNVNDVANRYRAAWARGETTGRGGSHVARVVGQDRVKRVALCGIWDTGK